MGREFKILLVEFLNPLETAAAEETEVEDRSQQVQGEGQQRIHGHAKQRLHVCHSVDNNCIDVDN